MLENSNPFNWGKEKVVSSPGAPVESEGKTLDTSVPMFHFTEEEVSKFKAEGKTDEEIDLLRKSVINKLARAQAEKMLN